MSCTYADGLSPYENKGILGIAETFNTEAEVEEKVNKLVEFLQSAKHVVVHTGAGISTTAGIPDFRGPKGVWTLEEKGEKPKLSISFNDAIPTITHMALRCLIANGYVQYIVSQNIDGLHLKSGLPRHFLSELHGNIFIEQCNKCRRQFVRSVPSDTVGQKLCGGSCRRECRGGLLLDNVLDWEHDLPERDLDLALMHSTLADLNITLGTTLQIIPSGNLPLKNKKHGGKLVICNLQPTKHDKKADLVINTYVDDILTKVCKRLGLEVLTYDSSEDPTKTPSNHNQEWTIQPQRVKEVEKQYNAKLKAAAAQRKSGKTPFTFFTKKEPTVPTKKLKLENKIEIKRAFVLTPSYELSMERAALICEKMSFKGCFSLTKTASGILFKFSHPDDYQAVYKKGFHKVTGARFYRKISIPCRPRKTFILYVLDVPEDLPVEDIRHSLYKFDSVVEVVRLHKHQPQNLISADKTTEASAVSKSEGIDKFERSEKKEFPSSVVRVTLASFDEYNTLLQNGLNFYDATFFPTEAHIWVKGAKVEYKKRMLDGSTGGRLRELLPVFDAAGFCKFAPPACKLIKPQKMKSIN